ncbi:cyclase family protein [Amycolatopsis sp. PS_44_ISF1]|uniref:cyclase family protein n=1 Tax=Amycolatopsis sp. PS_44_ISF1 TaxID=2974917 RepID=UPI0028DDCD99|nr:cyclase family protein [Amycolatopsis sp. PS_44_ISF1]MDT8911371.1 cyclase family protein [Amycolatopsis sp. PS_44_ISF1]
MQRWKNRPDGSNWGEFGEHDQIGRLNLITPERRRAAVAEVREGLAFPLSLPLDFPKGEYAQGFRKPPLLASAELGHNRLIRPGATSDVVNDDYAVLHLQYSTQWDSLAHVGARFDLDGTGEPVMAYYNGYRAGTDVIGDPEGSVTPHADALGIETLAQTSVQGRGVMVDLERAAGRGGAAVGHEQLMGILEEQEVVVEPGDILCLHTGTAAVILDLGERLTREDLAGHGAGLDGGDERLLRWITDSGVSAIVADNLAVESFGGEPAPGAEHLLPLHAHCLFKQGIPLGEMWYLSELNAWLRAHGRSRFLLTAPPLRLPGAVGSPVSGVATV